MLGEAGMGAGLIHRINAPDCYHDLWLHGPRLRPIYQQVECDMLKGKCLMIKHGTRKPPDCKKLPQDRLVCSHRGAFTIRRDAPAARNPSAAGLSPIVTIREQAGRIIRNGMLQYGWAERIYDVRPMACATGAIQRSLNTMSKIIQYGDFTFDFDVLPQASLMAMLRRGVSHFMGNEQASRVTGWFNPDADEPHADTPEARATKKAEFQAAAVKALQEGTVGVSTRGPSVDPIVSATRGLARGIVAGILKGQKLAVPTGDKTVTLNGTAYTMTQLIDRQIEKKGDSLRKDAEKLVAARAREKAKAQQAAAASGLDDL